MRDPALAKLQKVSEGLVFVSESDAPVEAFAWPGADVAELDPKALRTLAGLPKTAPVAEVPFGPFFASLTAEQDWHGDEEKAQVKGYRKLRKIIEAELTDPVIFRAGKVQVTYFIVGRTAKGNWAGVKADAVQT